MADVRSVLLFVAFVIIASVTSATKRLASNEDLLMKLEAMKRDTQCAGPAGRCFNTAHCCGGLICATFDEDIGEKPEIPGNCVKSKDLQACGGRSGRSCPSGSGCVPLGRTGQMYCVHHDREEEPESGSQGGGPKGGLGAECTTSRDCNPTSVDGSLKLCCQKVRRGRQEVKLLCDRVTPISVCIDTP